MGQQQLLLIALSVIIVGAAVAVGVNMMNQGAEEAEMDKFYQHASYVATNASAAYKKPSTMGGLDQDFNNIGSGTTAQKCSALGVKDSVGTSDIYISDVTIAHADSVTITIDDTEGGDGSGFYGKFTVNGKNGNVVWTERVTQR